MVGVLLIVVPATLFMGAAAFLPYPEADTIGRAIALALFIPLLAASIALTHNLYVALFDQRISRKRWTRIDDRLKSLGFRDATRSEVEHTLRLPVSLLAPRTLDVKRGGGIDHVTVGKVRGYEIRSFNVRIRGSGWLDVPALAVRVSMSFPPTVITRRLGTTAIPIPYMRTVMFEHERFNRRIAVHSTNRYFATALVDPPMMEWLRTGLDKSRIELSDCWIVVTCIPVRRHLANPQRLVNAVTEFTDRIPRAVPSLLSQTSPEMSRRLVSGD